jgi:KUP system potassium uptake protein
MVITTILIYYGARDLWKWRPWLALLVSAALLLVDLSFFLANLVKLFEGGFIPLVIALFIFTSMATWRRGRYILGQHLKQKALPVNRDSLRFHGNAGCSCMPGTLARKVLPL